ncbi:MAG: OsmC family peroxiredoxin [Bacteroidetes bacterium]|nr:OsmC family peroxiredoxin [Bacteroidota bacterium]
MSVNHATASWEGDLKSGTGHIKTERGSIDTPFTFGSRFEGSPGIGPEDLVAAAISGCFSMAISNELAGQGTPVTRVDTRSTVTLGPDPAGGFHISSIDLVVRATVPGISEESFQKATEATRTGCPIAKLYAGTTLNVDAQLIS